MVQARWRGPGLIACNLLALILLASWRWPPARQLWDRFDTWVFHLLNAPLAGNAAWAHVWAVCSMRPVDLGFGLIMLGLLLKGNWIFSAAQVCQALYALLFMLAWLVSGAHCPSDVLVGGLFLSLVAIGWGLYTPYAATACSLMERFGTPVLQRLGRLPGLRHISLLSSTH